MAMQETIRKVRILPKKGKSMKINRFVKTHTDKHSAFTLSLSAGYVNEGGVICREQYGAKDTFAVGMPVYSESGEELGRLSIGLWKHLDYSSRTNDGLEIPVEHWRIDGYKGKSQPIKTYFQHKAELVGVVSTNEEQPSKRMEGQSE